MFSANNDNLITVNDIHSLFRSFTYYLIPKLTIYCKVTKYALIIQIKLFYLYNLIRIIQPK